MARTVHRIIASIPSEGIERALPYVITKAHLANAMCDALNEFSPHVVHRVEEFQTSAPISINSSITFGKGATHAYHGRE